MQKLGAMYNDLSIRTKMILGEIALITAVAVFIYSYYPSQQKQVALKAIESKIQSISNMFSIGVGIGMGETDLVAVSEAMNWVNSDQSVVYVSVENTNHQNITSFVQTGFDVPPEVASLAGHNRLSTVGEVIYYKGNIVYQGISFGTLLVGYSLKGLDADINRLKLTTFYFCSVLFIAGVVGSIFIGNMITGNIRELDSTVKSISSGAEHIRVDVQTNDEIGKLGRAFNYMLERLDMSRDELIRNSEQLKKQNEELNRFSYVVSHDLKAPLRAIFKLSEWIEEDSGHVISEESKRNMQTLRGRVFRLEALINGLLEYSKIGRINIPMERVDVSAMLRETIDLLNPPSSFTISIQKEMPSFNTKKILLQQVFINFLSNAIKYNDKKEGVIRIASSDLGSHFRFTIEDNGMGIDPEYHEKIFEIFQTLESRDKVEGTGIGLSIIKKCVEDMGGIITLESEAGKGAKFAFTWRKKEQEPALKAEKQGVTKLTI